MNAVLYEVLKAAVVLAAVIMVRYAAPYLRMKVEESKYAWIIRWAETAVRSAEQTITDGGSGAEKKAVVTEFLKNILIKKNISISDDQLDNLIEAAVFAMNQGRPQILEPVSVAGGQLGMGGGQS